MAGRRPFQYRTPHDRDEALRFFRLANLALLGTLAEAEPLLEREGVDSVRVVTRGGKLVGGLAFQELGQWFGGRRIPCAAVRRVAVGAEHRGQGIADSMLAALHAELRARGIPLAVLFPATQTVYRRAGYEVAGSLYDYAVPAHELAAGDRADLEVAAVAPTDPRLCAMYRTRARRGAGLLDRNQWLWRRVLEPIVPTLDLSAYVLGRDEGYLVLHHERGPDPRRGTLTIRDRALNTPAALHRARALLAGHRSVIETVRLPGGAIEPLLVGLPNQLWQVARREDWMLKLVDPAAALAGRGYPPGVEARLEPALHDPRRARAGTRLLLEVGDGKATAASGGRGRLRLDLRGLAGMYSGHLRAEDARALGYLEGRPEDGARLDALFAGPAPSVNEKI